MSGASAKVHIQTRFSGFNHSKVMKAQYIKTTHFELKLIAVKRVVTQTCITYNKFVPEANFLAQQNKIDFF